MRGRRSGPGDDLFACPVCLERFSEPKVLPGCGHTICNSCVQQIVRRGDARCPVCRDRFRPNDVQTNYALQVLLDEVHEASSSATRPQSAAGRPQSAPLPIATLPALALSPQQPAPAASPLRGAPDLAPQLARTASTHLQGGRRKQLEFLGVPPRLAQSVAEEDNRVGRRIFLLDNSGSTAAYDGKIFEEVAGGRGGPSIRCHPCSRWDEIKQVATEHARWNSLLGTPCEFVLLNGSGQRREGIDFVNVDTHHTAAEPQIASLRSMLDRSGPQGGTPIAARVREIETRTIAHSASLFERGQSVVLVIVTDGLPTCIGRSLEMARQELMQNLRHIMTTLPLKVVIRLCTDDDDVTEFYNEVEQDLELPLDVLDDPAGEAQELNKVGNGWFAYTLALHRVREGGTFIKLLDLVDERLLSTVEVALLVHYLLQEPGAPPLSTDPHEFCDEVDTLASRAPLVYCVRRRKMVRPVDSAGLRIAVLGRLRAWLRAAERSAADYIAPMGACFRRDGEDDVSVVSSGSSSGSGV